MKKAFKVLVIIFVLLIICFVAYRIMGNVLVDNASELENVEIDVSNVKDGEYEGHSEMGPVIVDVLVKVKEGKIQDIELLRHSNGLGSDANSIVDDIVEKNTYDVDTISGATVSSMIIINAVNNALQKGVE